MPRARQIIKGNTGPWIPHRFKNPLSLPWCFVNTMHPDDKYLFEFDLDEKGRMQFDTDGQNPKFSDRAKAAQEAVRITSPRVV